MKKEKLGFAGKMRLEAKRFRRDFPLYIMMAPAIIVLIVNNYAPMPGIILAFKNLNYRQGILGSPWVGFNNFRFLFLSADAWRITRNTLGYNLLFIFLSVFLGIVTAIILSEILNKKLVKIYQSIIFIPFFLSWVVISYLVFSFLSSEKGILNNLLLQLGGDPVVWYSEPQFWPFVIVLVNSWKNFGYDSVIYLAAIVSIGKHLYEAAVIDGATKWQQIRYITLPSLKPIAIILVLLKVGRIFYADFGLFYNVPKNSGVLFNVTNVIDTYVFRSLFDSANFGMASAAGLYQATVGFLLVLFTNFVIKKVSPENALF